jgi:hypothetical protein
MAVKRWVAWGVGSLIPVILLAGCNGGPHGLSSSTSTTSTTNVATTTPTTGATTTTPTTGAATTHVEGFSPLTPTRTLAPGVVAVDHISGTACTMASSFDTGDQYAWRCVQSGGGFYDPCFAPPGQSEVTQVACVDDPWSGVTVMTLAQPLAHSSWGTPHSSQEEYPWAMVLANGQRCGTIEGTGSNVGGVDLNFGCTGGDGSFPDTGTEPWTVKYAANGSNQVVSVAVTTAWA